MRCVVAKLLVDIVYLLLIRELPVPIVGPTVLF
jgi:hypothetical protein